MRVAGAGRVCGTLGTHTPQVAVHREHSGSECCHLASDQEIHYVTLGHGKWSTNQHFHVCRFSLRLPIALEHTPCCWLGGCPGGPTPWGRRRFQAPQRSMRTLELPMESLMSNILSLRTTKAEKYGGQRAGRRFPPSAFSSPSLNTLKIETVSSQLHCLPPARA